MHRRAAGCQVQRAILYGLTPLVEKLLSGVLVSDHWAVILNVDSRTKASARSAARPAAFPASAAASCAVRASPAIVTRSLPRRNRRLRRHHDGCRAPRLRIAGQQQRPTRESSGRNPARLLAAPCAFEGSAFISKSGPSVSVIAMV